MIRRKVFRGLTGIVLILVACGDEPERVTNESVALVFDSPDALVQGLARAYRTRDRKLLQAILAHDVARNAEFVFFLSEPSGLGETQWGWTEEVRVHRRMFEPQNPIPDEDPVAPELWLRAVEVDLLPVAEFQERRDLYSTEPPENCPDGHCTDGKLDSRIWKAVAALYTTDVFFQLASEFAYQVPADARANFVVIEDLTSS